MLPGEINLTPVLLWQIEGYAERGATDRALDLTLIEAERLTAPERDETLEGFSTPTGTTRSTRGRATRRSSRSERRVGRSLRTISVAHRPAVEAYHAKRWTLARRDHGPALLGPA